MRLHCATLAVVLALGGLVAQAGVLFDNIPGGFDADAASYYESQRVPDAGFHQGTWIADDFRIGDEPLTLEGIEWVYDGFGTGMTAELIVVENGGEEFNVVHEEAELSYSSSAYPGSSTAMLGHVELGTPFVLEAGKHYYVGVRLAKEQYEGTAQHRIASVGSPFAAFSETSGAIKSPDFGMTDWSLISNAFGMNIDFGYRLLGEVVPEPTSLTLLLGGLAFAIRRR